MAGEDTSGEGAPHEKGRPGEGELGAGGQTEGAALAGLEMQQTFIQGIR